MNLDTQTYCLHWVSLAATFFPLALTFAVVNRIVVATLVTASFLEDFVMEGYVNKLGFTFNTKLDLGA